jgi:hypothetical protein
VHRSFLVRRCFHHNTPFGGPARPGIAQGMAYESPPCISYPFSKFLRWTCRAEVSDCRITSPSSFTLIPFCGLLPNSPHLGPLSVTTASMFLPHRVYRSASSSMRKTLFSALGAVNGGGEVQCLISETTILRLYCIPAVCIPANREVTSVLHDTSGILPPVCPYF